MNRKELSRQLEAQLKSLDPILRNPKKLRIAVVAIMLLAAIGGVYMPLKRGITERERELKQQAERARLCREIQLIEFNLTRYREHLPEHSDVNFWSEHMMTGMRAEGLLLRSFEPKEQDRVKVGSYQGLVIKAEIEGRYQEVLRFLAWLEYHEVFLRISKIRIDDHNGVLVTAITVAALTNQRKPGSRETVSGGS